MTLPREADPAKQAHYLFRPVHEIQSDQCYSDSVTYYTYKTVPESAYKNNKFGLYVYAENRKFLNLAADLVNSNGGDWGYVLIPYNVHDTDRHKWGEVFEILREKHLIPVIQLYDLDLDKYKSQTKKAARFLNSFLWPIRQHYVSVYNEPNDSRFWYGNADPAQYAEILDYTIDTFKEINSNFFMLNGALNVSATSGNGYIDAFVFMRRMNDAVPGIFNKLDGWASHPYPQPNFSGSPHTKGRYGIRAYIDELQFLHNFLHVEKDLPVFITETGWAHAEGDIPNSSYLDATAVATNFKIAYTQYWLKDARVQAVMPFTIWYPAPFDHFSWITENYDPYLQYDVVKSLPKVAGTPEELILESSVASSCD